MKTIYLDYNATTPVDPAVVEAMIPFFSEFFGNPSSVHEHGKLPRTDIEKARRQIAELIGCDADEIIFTSGGTESNNLAIKGFALQNVDKGNHLIISSIEHPSVMECCHWLEKNGFHISLVRVDMEGRIDIKDLISKIRKETILISVMHANNETGTIQPVEEIANLAHERGIIFHSDAAQSVGKTGINLCQLQVDMLSLAGHKIYAPKGIGALYIKAGLKLQKLMHGAEHEKGLRAGTENVPYIVALGKACEIARNNFPEEPQKLEKMRNYFRDRLRSELPEIRINGHERYVLPNTLNVGFPDVEADHFLHNLNRISASAGAACHAGQTTVSPVLKAMQVPVIYARGSIRFSLGRFTTMNEIEFAVDCITVTYKKMVRHRKSFVKNFDEKNYQQLKEESEINVTGKNKVYHAGAMTYNKLIIGENPGCSCKIRSSDLRKILSAMKYQHNENVLSDVRTNEDACVYRITGEIAMVQSIDFFSPLVEDPYHFGMIAAANALSDIYAMGAKPLFAQNILSYPVAGFHPKVIRDILRGAQEKCCEAGIPVTGGHSVDDTDLKFGLSVTGLVNVNKILYNSKAKPGDYLLLTKPLGSGILLSALKKELISEENRKKLLDSLEKLNKWPEGILEKYQLSACTDITGFGFLGHLAEMTIASKVDAEVWMGSIPLFDGLEEAWNAGASSCTADANLSDIQTELIFDHAITPFEKTILTDAQSSGGLLISIREIFLKDFINEMIFNGIDCFLIGKISAMGTGRIWIKK